MQVTATGLRNSEDLEEINSVRCLTKFARSKSNVEPLLMAFKSLAQISKEGISEEKEENSIFGTPGQESPKFS